jgi:hypothetical protein
MDNKLEKATAVVRTALPFEQQARESSKAFAAFQVYLRMGPQRSLAAVGQQLGKSRIVIERWSAKFGWVSRVQAHAAHLAEVERKAIEARAIDKSVEWSKVQESVRREAWSKSEKLMEIADRFIERWENCSRIPGMESVVKCMDLAFKLKQFAAGMPAEIKEVNTNVSGVVELDWEMALKKIYGAAAAKRAAAEAQAKVVEVEAKQIEAT